MRKEIFLIYSVPLFLIFLGCNYNLKSVPEIDLKKDAKSGLTRYEGDIKSIVSYEYYSGFYKNDTATYNLFRLFTAKEHPEKIFYLGTDIISLKTVVFAKEKSFDLKFDNVIDTVSPFHKLQQLSESNNKCCHNAGLRNMTNKEGIVITLDLCPSVKALEKEMINYILEIISPNKIVPLVFCVSGQWIKSHKSELDYLLKLEKENKIDICWANHGNFHKYEKELPLNNNFMLMEGTDVDSEILETEKIMIENGIIPSCFIRFPGLVSDEKLLNKVIKNGLLPLGTSAWIANNVSPKQGDIILLHGNGNEPGGFTVLKKLYKQGKFNFEIIDIYSLLTQI